MFGTLATGAAQGGEQRGRKSTLYTETRLSCDKRTRNADQQGPLDFFRSAFAATYIYCTLSTRGFPRNLVDRVYNRPSMVDRLIDSDPKESAFFAVLNRS